LVKTDVMLIAESRKGYGTSISRLTGPPGGRQDDKEPVYPDDHHT
jgi:hypothetical protein